MGRGNKRIGIYKITSPSGKVYIGQSVDINQRKSHQGKKLSDSHIAKLKKRSGANHSGYGKPRSQETKDKLSKALKGANHPNYGKSPSEEIKQKIAQTLTGRKRPPEVGKKVSAVRSETY